MLRSSVLHACLVAATAFQLDGTTRMRAVAATTRASEPVVMNWAKAKPIHTEPDNIMKSVFTVEKATEEQLAEMNVKSWPTWSTAGSTKYKVGFVSPLKLHDTNELSYLISGKVFSTREYGQLSLP